MSQLWLLLLFLGVGAAHDPLVVDTSTGKLRGYWMTSRSGRRFLAFAGVPFAKPPVGPLRFQPTAEAERWNGSRIATEHGPLCAQYNTFAVPPVPACVEDCLYLSVYTHKNECSPNPEHILLFHDQHYLAPKIVSQFPSTPIPTFSEPSGFERNQEVFHILAGRRPVLNLRFLDAEKYPDLH